jgi:hypothetical protein
MQAALGIFERRAAGHSVTELLRSTTFFSGSRPCCSTIVPIFVHKRDWNPRPGADAQSSGRQIPDTAPCLPWLAIVCSIVVAVLRSPILKCLLKCHPRLRVLPVGGRKALRQLARDREKAALAFPQ